jgi:formylglycine-generating enzyme required for sulfatase activity
MRNFAIGCIVLFAMAGTACNKEPKPSGEGKALNEAGAGGEAKSPLKEFTVDLGNGVKLEMVLIPASEFLMGSPDSDKDNIGYVKPQHRVRITKPFYLGKYLVTQEQWQAVMDEKPSHFKGPKYPVELVSSDDFQRFVQKLNVKIGTQNGKFALPTEAQWEYACRAGSTTKYCFGDDEARLGDYAWFGEDSGNKTHPVGEKKPNAWGLYDMHGNIWEWCQDWYGRDYYANSPTDDPTGPATGAGRVIRGGCWRDPARLCRSAARLCEPVRGVGLVDYTLTRGFRVSLVPADK